MRVECWFHVDAKLAYSRLTGHLTAPAFEKFREAIVLEARYDPDFIHLIDIRDLDALSLDAQAIRAMAGRAIYSPDSLRAIIASSDLSFGFARMADAHFAEKRRNSRTFRELAPALEWLELAPDFPLQEGEPVVIDVT